MPRRAELVPRELAAAQGLGGTRRFAFVVGSSASDPDALIQAVMEEDPAQPLPLSPSKLRLMGVAAALPFVGFGFLDNFIMIIAGEYIDSTLCVTFSFSTMAAAAIGNTLSDLCGIFSGGAVESLAAYFGVEEPPMTKEQRAMWSSKVWHYGGQSIGIVVGCLLGCAPLLWIDAHEADRLKREKEKDATFQQVVDKLGSILGAEAAALVLMDKEHSDLYSANCSANLPSFRADSASGLFGQVFSSGHYINIADMQEEGDGHNGSNLPELGLAVQSMLLMPIFSGDKVIGALALFNKHDEGAFTTKDEDILSAITTHVSAVLVGNQTNFLEILSTIERTMDRQGSPVVATTASKQRRDDLFPAAMGGVNNVIGAEASYLVLVNEKSGELYTETVVGGYEKMTTRVGEGPAGRAVEKGEVVSVSGDDLQERFGPATYATEGGEKVAAKSVLCYPIFDSARKCIGCIECINKYGDKPFDADDARYLKEVALNLAILLEGEDAALRRIVATSRMKLQHKDVIERTRGPAVICHVESAQKLVGQRSSEDDGGINPYVTLSIERGNPLQDQDSHFTQRTLRRRERDRQKTVRRFCRSATLTSDANPTWDQTIAVVVPREYRGVAEEELFLHLLVWDYDPLNRDEIIGQAAFPLAQMPTLTPKQTKMFSMQAPPGQDGPLGSRLWVSFTRQHGAVGESSEDMAEPEVMEDAELR